MLEKVFPYANLIRQISTIIEQTSGMFAVAGPTGPGMTTTLYGDYSWGCAGLNGEGL